MTFYFFSQGLTCSLLIGMLRVNHFFHFKSRNIVCHDYKNTDGTGLMTIWCFISLSTLFMSYWGNKNERLHMQWAEFCLHRNSNLGPQDSKVGSANHLASHKFLSCYMNKKRAMMADLNIIALTEPDLELIKANILTKIQDDYINKLGQCSMSNELWNRGQGQIWMTALKRPC